MKTIYLAFFASALVWGCAQGSSSSDTTGGGGNGAGTGGSPVVGAGGREALTTSSSVGAGPGTTSATTGGGTTSTTGGASTTSSSTSGGAGGSEYNTPVTCTSNVMYAGGNNANMRPGEACKSCHVLLGQATGKTFDIGGTVYPTAHEPNDCDGTGVTGATVVITDGMGADHVLPVNGVGNFYHQDLFGFAAFPLPYHAKVVFNGQERKMIAPQMTGDCNSCHTEGGTQSAPGRIMLP